MDNFVRKLKKGNGKYNGKLPSKCLYCGKIGHFSNKFSYSKNKENDEEEGSNKENKSQKGDNKRNKNKFFKKSIYSKEGSSSFDKDNDSNNE
jgi:hypothetical protein